MKQFVSLLSTSNITIYNKNAWGFLDKVEVPYKDAVVQ